MRMTAYFVGVLGLTMMMASAALLWLRPLSAGGSPAIAQAVYSSDGSDLRELTLRNPAIEGSMLQLEITTKDTKFVPSGITDNESNTWELLRADYAASPRKFTFVVVPVKAGTTHVSVNPPIVGSGSLVEIMSGGR